MRKTKVSHDATASTRGTLYQIWVAVEKCFEMHQSGQKMLIETQGDVSGENQIEVKQYSDNLTDNHLCFWKTLKNWVHDDFDPSQYKSLILLTTQQFGPAATIANWNSESKDKRLEIIQAIYSKNKEKYNKGQNQKSPIPESLELQEYIFAKKREDKLNDVLGRFFIEAQSPEMPELYSRIKGQYLKGILEGKKEAFLQTLFGYISQPTNNGSQKWEITFEDYSQKVRELTGVYGHETKAFPRVSVSISDDDVTTHKTERLFAQKIIDIEYTEVLRKAIEHYYIALQTVNEEFKTYAVPQQRTEQYSKDIVEYFQIKHGAATRNCTDVIRDSKNLYDEVTSSTPQTLSGFDSTPLAFRNGLLHAEMDDKDKDLKWRVE